MALTVTSRGTGTHNTGATTLTPGGRSATLAVGSMGVLAIALDNAGGAGDVITAPTTATDSKGNIWTRRTSALFDNGAASAGIEMAWYTAPITAALLTSDTLVLTWSPVVSPVAKVWTWYEVIPSGSNTVEYTTGGTIAGAAAANASITTATVPIGDAVIAGYFSENVGAVTADSDTTNGSWAAQQTTTIGTTTSGVRIATQAKVQTTAASTQTYNVTVASQDRIAGYILLHEAAPPPPPAADYEEAVLNLSPSAYWRMDDPSGTTMTATVGPNGTYVNTPTLGVTGGLTGDPSTAVTFVAASSEHATVADATELDLGDVFSITFWMKRANTTATSGRLLGKGNSAYSVKLGSAAVSNDPGHRIYLDRPGVNFVANSSIDVADTNWHFVVITKNSTTERKVWIDGVDVTVLGSNEVFSDNASAFYLGRDALDTQPYDGTLDEVALFKTVLTPAQVAYLYTAGTTAPAGPSAYADAVTALTPVGYWRLGDTGTTAVAVVGPNGTYSGSPTQNVTGLLTGDANKAVTFDATDDTINLGDQTWFDGTNKWTIAVWWNHTPAATYRRAVAKEDSGNLGTFLHTQSSQWGVGRYGTDSVEAKIASGAATGTHFIVGTYGTDNIIRLYSDGVQVAASAATTTSLANHAEPLRISGYGTGANNLFGGTMDEVAIFDRALTAAEIANLYAVGTGATGESHSGSGSLSQTNSMTASGAKGAVGTGTFNVTVATVATGIENSTGVAAMSVTSTMPASGVKAATNVGSFSHAHTMPTTGVKGAVGVAAESVASTMVASGVKAEPEVHSGTGSMAVVVGDAATASKQGIGTGLIAQTHSMTYAQVKAAFGTGTVSQPVAMAHTVGSARSVIATDTTVVATPASGVKGASAAVSVTQATTMVATGSAAEAHAGAGTMTVVESDVATAAKGASSAATWPVTVGMTASGVASELHSGTGAISQAHTAVATGTHAGVGTATDSTTVTTTASGTGAAAGSGTGAMTVTVTMPATGLASRSGAGSFTQAYSMTYDGSKQSFSVVAVSVASSTPATGASQRAGTGADSVVTSTAASGVAGRSDAGSVALVAGMTATGVHGGTGVGTIVQAVDMTTGQGKVGTASMSVATSALAVGEKASSSAAIWASTSGISGVGAKGASSDVAASVASAMSASGVAGHPATGVINVSILMAYAAATARAGGAATYVGVGMTATARVGGRPRGTTGIRTAGTTSARGRGGTDVRAVGATIERDRGATAVRS